MRFIYANGCEKRAKNRFWEFNLGEGLSESLPNPSGVKFREVV
jgi:hypothetical protein